MVRVLSCFPVLNRMRTSGCRYSRLIRTSPTALQCKCMYHEHVLHLLALEFLRITINYMNLMQEPTLDIIVKRSAKLTVCWLFCLTGNLLCFQSTRTSQTLLEKFTLHKPGRDLRLPRHSPISSYNNILPLKCNISSLSLELNRDKTLGCCKVLLHLSRSLLLLVKFHSIFVTSVDRLAGHM